MRKKQFYIIVIIAYELINTVRWIGWKKQSFFDIGKEYTNYLNILYRIDFQSVCAEVLKF